MSRNLFVILGNQLFEPKILKQLKCSDIFMAEDHQLCTYQKHHKLKLYLFLCAMREYRDELESSGLNVSYFKLEDRDRNQSYADLKKYHLAISNKHLYSLV